MLRKALLVIVLLLYCAACTDGDAIASTTTTPASELSSEELAEERLNDLTWFADFAVRAVQAELFSAEQVPDPLDFYQVAILICSQVLDGESLPEIVEDTTSDIAQGVPRARFLIVLLWDSMDSKCLGES